jgi:hypothetical protein
MTKLGNYVKQTEKQSKHKVTGREKLCDGCGVRQPWEHRCTGIIQEDYTYKTIGKCRCPICQPAT